MNTLNQIKQTLFTATDYADALSKLAAINANVTTYESYSVIDEFGIVFFATRKNKTLPMVVTIDGVSPSVTIDQYYAVHAQQQPDLSQSVPAHDSLVVVEQPLRCQHDVVLLGKPQLHSDDAAIADSNFIPEQSTVFVDKKIVEFFKPRLELALLRSVLSIERRLRLGKAKGLSS